MAKQSRVIVLSDLHLGPDNDCCTFRDEKPLASLLLHLAQKSRSRPLELVLAGDIFDFLQVKGYGGFDAALSAQRFEEIQSSPRTNLVLRSLRTLANSPGLEISLLSGNHDPELLVPCVRDQFEAAIGRKGSVLYADDEPLQPGSNDKWPIWGRALGQTDSVAWVIHGDRWDPLNAIHRDHFREAIAAGKSVTLPVGSHLVFEVLQKLKPSYPWIDQLVPETAVMLLLIYIDPLRANEFFHAHLGLTARSVRGMVEAALHRGPLFGPQVAEAQPSEESREQISLLLAEVLAEAILEEPQARRNSLLAELESRLRGDLAPPLGTLAEHGGLGKLLLRAGLRSLRWSNQNLNIDRSDSIQENAPKYAPKNVATIVAGHTHGARVKTDIYPSYFNTGTWLPVGRIPPGRLTELVDQLEQKAWPAESPRTFVQVDLGTGSPIVRLFSCDRAGQAREVRDA